MENTQKLESTVRTLLEAPIKLQLPSNFRRIPTPRTNEEVKSIDANFHDGDADGLGAVVDAEFARQLERELAVAMHQLEALRASHAATTWRDTMGT